MRTEAVKGVEQEHLLYAVVTIGRSGVVYTLESVTRTDVSNRFVEHES